MLKKIGYFVIWSLVLAMVSLSLGFSIYERKKIVCTDVRVEITDSVQNQFVRSKEIRDWVLSHHPHLLHQNLENIDLRVIEDGLSKFKAVEEATVFTSIVGRGKPGEGSVVVRIRQWDRWSSESGSGTRSSGWTNRDGIITWTVLAGASTGRPIIPPG